MQHASIKSVVANSGQTKLLSNPSKTTSKKVLWLEEGKRGKTPTMRSHWQTAGNNFLATGTLFLFFSLLSITLSLVSITLSHAPLYSSFSLYLKVYLFSFYPRLCTFSFYLLFPCSISYAFNYSISFLLTNASLSYFRLIHTC